MRSAGGCTSVALRTAVAAKERTRKTVSDPKDLCTAIVGKWREHLREKQELQLESSTKGTGSKLGVGWTIQRSGRCVHTIYRRDKAGIAALRQWWQVPTSSSGASILSGSFQGLRWQYCGTCSGCESVLQ
jgi:hypothetical protein